MSNHADSLTSIGEIEEDISRHREKIHAELHAISAKSRRRNDLLPIARLLPELLSSIFILFAQDPLSWVSFSPSGSVGPYGWIVVTHVCYHWREVALSTPRLWSYIFLGPPERITIFLERSRQAPLTVLPWSSRTDRYRHNPVRSFNNMLPSTCAASMRLILAQSHRIQSLHVELADKILERVFGVFAEDGFCAPILSSLKFRSVSPSETGVLPNILSRDLLPKLTHIELRGYSVPWNFLSLRTNLTSLIIHHNYSPSFPIPSFYVNELLVCLSHMPRLRILDVNAEYCRGQCELVTSSTSSLPFVDVSRLEDISLRLDAASVDAFVTHCNFPPSAHMSFETTIRHDHSPQLQFDDNISSIAFNCIGLITGVKSEGDKAITGLSIVFHSLPLHELDTDWTPSPPLSPGPLCQISIRAYQSDFRFEDEVRVLSPRSLPPSHFSLKFNDRSSHAVTLLNNALLQLPLSDLAFLDVTGAGCELGPIGADLSQLLKELIQRSSPGLEYLRLSGSGVDILPHILDSFATSQRVGKYGRSLFSHIQTLILHEMIAGARWYDHEEDTWEGTRVNHICTAIRSQVQSYKWSCGPFARLILESARESREWLEELLESFSELFGQEGRFTREPHYEPYLPPSSSLPGIIPASWGPEIPEYVVPHYDNPDSDLDQSGWSPPFTPVAPQRHGDWMDHARYGRVVFDFKGNGGLKIVQVNNMN